MRRAVKAGREWEMKEPWPRDCFGAWCMVRLGMEGIGWDGWMDGCSERRSDREDQGLVLVVLALSLGDRFMGGEDAELVADGRRVLVREGTAVGWLRAAEWCLLGLSPSAWCRVASGLAGAWARASEASAGLRRVCGLRTRLTWFRFVRPPHAATQASQNEFAGDMSSAAAI